MDTTAVIATCQGDMDLLRWSVLSLLTRSHKNVLKKIIVIINGGDARTWETKLQDQKERWLLRLGEIAYQKTEIHLETIRVWSRVGHCQCLDMAMPCIDTETVTMVHDDTIVLEKGWESVAFHDFLLPNVALVSLSFPFEASQVAANFQPDRKTLLWPHPCSTFLVARCAPIMQNGWRWVGYHLNQKFKVDDIDEVSKGHMRPGWNSTGSVRPPQPGEEFDCASYDIGSWLLYRMHQLGYTITSHPYCNHVMHFHSMSWVNAPNLPKLREKHKPVIDRLMSEAAELDAYASS